MKIILLAVSILMLLAPSAFAQECKSLLINGANSWLPIAYRDKNNDLNGVAVTIGQEISGKLGLKVVQGPKTTWTETLENLEQGNVDIVAGAYFNAARAKTFIYSSSFFQNQARIFVKRTGRFEVNSLEDLIGRKGARPKGGSFGEAFDQFDRKNLKMDQVTTSKDVHLLDRLLDGKADFIISDLLDGRLSIREKKLSKHVVALPYKVSVNDVHFLISRKSPCANKVNDINRTIADMHRSGRIKQIVEQELSKLIH